MQLIQWSAQNKKNQGLRNTELQKTIQQLKKQYNMILSSQTNSKDINNIQLIFSNINSNSLSLIKKISIKNQIYLKLQISFFQKTLLKANYTQHKTTLVRYFISLNNKYKNIKFQTSPLSGICIQNLPQSTHQFLTNLEQYEHQYNQLSKQMQIILYHLNHPNKKLISLKSKYSLQQIKQFTMVSPYYAWTMLKSNTKSKNLKNKLDYMEFRKKFIQKTNNLNTDNYNNHETNYNQINFKSLQQKLDQEFLNQTSKNRFINTFDKQQVTKVFQSTQSQTLFNYPSIKNQQQFQQKYLKATKPLNKNTFLINLINLDDNVFNQLLLQKQIKTNVNGCGNVHLAIAPCNQDSINHQRKILQKFQNKQYLSLPKYYFPQNIKYKNYLITNLNSIVKLSNYLKKNSITLSFVTKLHILYQISLAIKTCRDYSIVHHKIIPQTIYIRKGLFVKLTDFSHAFHDSIKIDNRFFQKNSYLPFVSLYQPRANLLFGNQKADVFSFGNIIYYTLYYKTPFQFKYSYDYPYNDPYKQQSIQKMCRNQLIAIQKNHCYNQQFQLLVYMSLKCVNHHKYKNIKQIQKQQIDQSKQILKSKDQSKLINMKDRPYLDWIIVLIRAILQNYKQRQFL